MGWLVAAVWLLAALLFLVAAYRCHRARLSYRAATDSLNRVVAELLTEGRPPAGGSHDEWVDPHLFPDG
jgi:carbon starvation protein CstA